MADGSALLWCLRGHGRDVRCLRQPTTGGIELRVLWGDELFLTETFRDEQRLLKRSEEFRATLLTRGWSPMEDCEAGTAPSGPGRTAAPNIADRGGGGLRPRDAGARGVLIVDDEPSVRAFLRRYLQDAGYRVAEADDVETALNALDREAVDAVVLDVRLPDPMGWGRTGLEVLAFIRLHSTFSGLPVLILTGYALEPEEQDLIARHHADLFLKPDGYRTLLQRLDQLTGGPVTEH